MNDMKSFWHKGETFYYITKDVDIDLREKNGVEMATCYMEVFDEKQYECDDCKHKW